ncbi:thioredoxin domain-containing protein [Brevundimonas sp. R86498]|uniref:DsbA family protein n=1 Tax=Brevundimonas sp. R86498 TaxID=3093845 RepID=UPI0037CAB022
MTDETPASPLPSPAPARDPFSWLASGRGGAAALAVSVVALGLAAAPYLTGGDFGGRVRAYLLANPGVLDEVVQARQQAEETGRVETINRAVAANAALLAPDPRDPAFGPADAKVTVIEFFDYRCPGCKAVSPEVLALMEANPDVRFVFKEWPILDRGDTTTSNYAARAALAAHRQGRYLPVHQALMAEAALTPESIDAILAANGVDMARAAADIADTGTDRQLADIHTIGATLGLVGTPTFLINGRTTASINPQEVQAAITAAKAG